MLIIYAHPNKDGHCGCFLENVVKILREEKVDFEIVDLYQIGFSPLLKPEEHYTSGQKQVAPQVRKIQEKIKQHDRLIFIYPTWWQNVPAILKGFIDRVFLPGFGFSYKGKLPRGLLKEKKALIFTSTGAPRYITKILYGDRSVKVIKKDILSFCGIKSDAFVIDNAKHFSDTQKNRINRVVSKALKRFFTLLFVSFLVLPGFSLSRIDNWQDVNEKKCWLSGDEKQEVTSKEVVSSENMYLCALAVRALRQEGKAEALYLDIPELSAVSILARWHLAEIKRRNHKIEECWQIPEKIIRLQPDYVPARIRLAYVFHIKEKYDECLDVVSRIQEKCSDNLDTGSRICTHLMTGGT